eukprot:GFUD01029958.1.p1 GENE.GFUD01029958.1~~GFUD01029958.1.p1  ORF type:complete len:752 (+),score=258.64 GFUD01029958.1:60-2315(+)
MLPKLVKNHIKLYNKVYLQTNIWSQTRLHIKPFSGVSQLLLFNQVSFLESLDHQRTFSTTLTCSGGNNKTRKMIKDKNMKKDPEAREKLKNEQRKSSSHLSKYLNKPVSNKTVQVWANMSVKDLSEQTNIDINELFDVVLSFKEVDTDYIDSEDQPLRNIKLLNMLANKLHYKNMFIADPDVGKKEKVLVNKDARRSPPPEEKDLLPRPPVVTIMGHIDHGKTSLLDYLRKSRIVAGEAGGITQHIGAFSVELESGEMVTFIDTPGHAAFTAMRTRGATATDIVILIIDSCEGVLEQTKESLRIIRQTRVPFIVALNKIDKPASDVEMTKKQLEAEGVRLEGSGGDVQCVSISALQGTNVKQLIEAVLTQAEMMELRCDVKGKAEGLVIESQVEQGLGKTATVLLERGVLKPGGFLVSGNGWCKVRLLIGDRGDRVAELRPSQAAKVVGWKEVVPSAGTEVLAVESEARAKEVVSYRSTVAMKEQAEAQEEAILDIREQEREQYLEFRKFKRESGWFKPRFGRHGLERKRETKAESDQPVVAVVVKGDVDGSVDAILSCFETYHEEEVKLDIVHFGVGEVTETDITMAESFNGIIYAFNTTVPHNIQKLADTSKVPVRAYDVIYHLIADLKQELSSRMPPVQVEEVIGRANVVQEFQIKDKKNLLSVAGCRVVSGKIPRIGTVKVVRGQETVYLGELASLKHLKEEVSEIVQNQECGVRVADSELKFEAGDQVLAIEAREEANTCKWDPGF